ncbi:hypothetical protein MRB53_040709 [Persea americana]|nr:hypothetical protein MRB53_040709 [Persea americana]
MQYCNASILVHIRVSASVSAVCICLAPCRLVAPRLDIIEPLQKRAGLDVVPVPVCTCDIHGRSLLLLLRIQWPASPKLLLQEQIWKSCKRLDVNDPELQAQEDDRTVLLIGNRISTREEQSITAAVRRVNVVDAAH